MTRAEEVAIIRTIGATVRDANRSDIARRTGITLSHVSRVLSGKRIPSSTKLSIIATAMGVSMGDLYIYLVSLHQTPRGRAAA